MCLFPYHRSSSNHKAYSESNITRPQRAMAENVHANGFSSDYSQKMFFETYIHSPTSKTDLNTNESWSVQKNQSSL